MKAPEHFTKPTYLGQPNPPINQNRFGNNENRRSQSLPQFDPPGKDSKNMIPNRPPSGGFKASFLPSEAPMSARDHREIMNKQPVSYPSGYGDSSQLGASAARITELMKKTQEGQMNQWTGQQDDCKPDFFLLSHNFILNESLFCNFTPAGLINSATQTNLWLFSESPGQSQLELKIKRSSLQPTQRKIKA